MVSGRVRQKGSHILMREEASSSTITVPVPDREELRRGTLLAIIKQSGLSRVSLTRIGSRLGLICCTRDYMTVSITSTAIHASAFAPREPGPVVDPFLTGNALADITRPAGAGRYILVSHAHGASPGRYGCSDRQADARAGDFQFRDRDTWSARDRSAPHAHRGARHFPFWRVS